VDEIEVAVTDVATYDVDALLHRAGGSVQEAVRLVNADLARRLPR